MMPGRGLSGHLASIALLTSASAAMLAQAPPSPAQARQPKSGKTDAAYAIEQQYQRVKFEADGNAHRELSMRVKVMDEQAVRAWGQLPFTYNSATEELALQRIAVQKPDGTVAPTDPSAIQDLAVRPFAQLPIFLDVHQKLVTISALRPGDVLLVDAVWTTTHPLIPGQFCFQHVFNTAQIVQDERLEIDVPASKPLIVRTRPGAPAEEHDGNGEITGARRVYRWRSANPVVKKDDTADTDRDEAPPPDVRLTTFKSWDEVARWYRGLLPKSADAAVQAKAAELTKGLPDPAARIDAIYTYVSTQIRYVSLSFGLGRYAPHAPGEVLVNQYGDCKDKETLLAALLAAVGIDSAPVLVNSTRSVADDVPSPLEFDHVVAAVPRGPESDWIWLDSTLEVAPSGMFAPTLRHRTGLLVGNAAASSRLVTTPTDPPFAAVDRVAFDGAVNAIGVLKARVTYTFHSDAELLLRATLRTIPRESWSDFVQGLTSQMGLEGDVTDVSVGDPADTRHPLQIALTLRRAKYLDWAAASSEVPVPSPQMRLPGAKEDDRKDRSRVKLGAPSLYAVGGTIAFPASYTPQPPVPITTANAGVEYRSTYRVEGSRLTIERELRNTAREVSAAQYGAYSALVRAVDADVAQQVKVRGAAPAVPAIPADSTALEVYHAALSAYNVSKYDAAVTLWKRTTELDPKMGDAWVSLGLAYDRLDKHDEAAAAIRKQIELDPFNKRAYGDLGHVLKNGDRLKDAAAAYAKHVDLNPLDGNALKELGEIYWDLRRYAEAAQTLEKAAALVKPDGWMLALLGASYLQTGERDKANRAFDRAIETAPTAAVLTKIAWELSERDAELPRAAELASRAERKVSEETRDLTFETSKASHWDLMERLAWSWDVLGWCRFQTGDVASAEKYVRAAWKLGGYVAMADHLGQILEKQQHRAEAMSLYLTSESLTSTPTERARAGIARLTDRGADLNVLHEAARLEYARDRAVTIQGSWPEGSAEFELVVGTDRRAVQVRFKRGLEALRPMEARLREISYPVEFPDEMPLRLVLLAHVICDANGTCLAGVAPTFRGSEDR